MIDDQSTPDHVVLVETFARSSPDQLFQYFVDPDLLVQWWPQTAEVEPRLGGTYHLAWPSMNWHLRGDYTEFSPGDVLAFTWKWDHDRAKPVRTVRITLAPVETEPSSRSSMVRTPGLRRTRRSGRDTSRAGRIFSRSWVRFLRREFSPREGK